VFCGLSALNLDDKGRLAVPSRYREQLNTISNNQLILTLNPLDRCLWLYPFPEWAVVDSKLQTLPDFDKQSYRTKQMMRAYAAECELDNQGRIRIPEMLREFAGLKKRVVFLGQGNKFEIWDEAVWNREREEWLQQLDEKPSEPSELLRSLSL
jgi:MraZ protein